MTKKIPLLIPDGVLKQLESLKQDVALLKQLLLHYSAEVSLIVGIGPLGVEATQD